MDLNGLSGLCSALGFQWFLEWLRCSLQTNLSFVLVKLFDKGREGESILDSQQGEQKQEKV